MSGDLSWKLQFLSLQNFGDVKVEEITVEYGLYTSSNNSDDVIEALAVVPVDPVENVETSVRAKGKQVVAGDRLSLASLGYHEQLGQDSNRFQVDREGPQNFHNREFMVEDKSQKSAGAKQKLNPEGVMVTIIGGLELDIHQIHSGRGGGHEEQFHRCVVQGDKVGEKVQVAGHKHNQEKDLRFARYTST